MALQLVTDELIGEARRRTGLERFDSDSYREGLDILVSDINRDERPDPLVQRTREAFVKALADRLKTTAYLDAHPGLLKRPVRRPIFVFGIPRTGTTLLSNLLAADPAHRSPLTWEIDEPVPPATSKTLYTDPRAVAALDAHNKLLAAYPEMGKYYRGSPVYPNECVFIMAHDFKTLMWESRGILPNYRDWIFSTDVTSAYEYHKRFLQLLQSEAPGVWNLKMPSHALYIQTLLKIYPDARLVWTHRDPLTATGSFCSLLTLGQQGFRGKIDHDWLGRNCSWQAVQHADRIMDAREQLGHDRIIDVHYADLMRNPIETMRALYKSTGDEFTAQAEAGMRAWLADNPQDKFGRHEYKLAKFGLTEQSVRSMFERYLSKYEVEREG
jgi:hypothetical protein